MYARMHPALQGLHQGIFHSYWLSTACYYKTSIVPAAFIVSIAQQGKASKHVLVLCTLKQV
jgi:hypothetical protein